MASSLNFARLENKTVEQLFELPWLKSKTEGQLFELPKTKSVEQLFELSNTKSVGQLFALPKNLEQNRWALDRTSQYQNPKALASCLKFQRL